ncbi:hypothetical protein BU26DRAFT_568334 [Trematosphaeria pertusa]|uniref:Cytochrome P450 n=1 Tax=Trematosphaeria pertusa TaxID=390896 RepID=A0A6A6I8E8_9PLEO|nr:uncharacterized protein BU26DRAFT_568334 [Trematosphaeria pertusa]KAF2245790.1 hypothetical protein BU26DRAFT_568334 [Trematosphaeria pertusa]
MTVITPENVLHTDKTTDKTIWGPGAASFSHRRFVNSQANKKTLNPAAFRAFGGGATLCPGRHFATTEILAAAAMLIARFEMEPAGGEGRWPEPDRQNSKLWA